MLVKVARYFCVKVIINYMMYYMIYYVNALRSYFRKSSILLEFILFEKDLGNSQS